MNNAKFIFGILLTVIGVAGIIMAAPIYLLGLIEQFGPVVAILAAVAAFVAIVAILIVGVRLFIPQIKTEPLPIRDPKRNWTKSFAIFFLAHLSFSPYLQ